MQGATGEQGNGRQLEIAGAFCARKGYKNYIKEIEFQRDAVSYEGCCQMSGPYLRPVGIWGQGGGRNSLVGRIEEGSSGERRRKRQVRRKKALNDSAR